MSNMFLGANIPKIQNSQKITPIRVDTPNINKGIENFWGPITNFFQENPTVIPDNLSSQINKISTNAANYEEMFLGTEGRKLNFMG